MRKKLLFILFILSIVSSFSQTKEVVYVDENYKEISLFEFERRLKSELFFYVDFATDTIDYKKLKFREFFGHIGFEKKKQLNKFFKKRYNIKNDKIWVIHYYDSLPVVENMPKKMKFEVKSDSSNHVVKLYGTHEDFKKGLRRMKEEYWQIKNAKLYNFYNRRNGYPIGKSIVKWYKDDNSMLKNIFGDGIGRSHTLIIFRHGDFYFSPTARPLETEKMLLNNQTLNKIKNSWKRRYKNLQANPSILEESHIPE